MEKGYPICLTKFLKNTTKKITQALDGRQKMSDALNRLLRSPAIKFFENIYPHLPHQDNLLWFFSRQYFLEGWSAKEQNWTPLKKQLRLFTKTGYRVLLNFCTEDATGPIEAAHTRDTYLEFIESINSLHCSLSVRLSMKMSQFGCFHQNTHLDAFGKETAEHVIRSARRYGNIGVTLDGERLVHAEEVALFVRAMQKKYGNVAIRFQAYNPDFNKMLQEFIKRNIMENNIIPIGICKGAYHEPTALSADKTRENIIEGVLNCAEENYPVSVDTNDHTIIEDIREELRCSIFRNKPRPSFGLLYNIKPWLARRLKNAGEAVHIYFPVIKKRETGADAGSRKQWEKFAIRRVEERPLYLLYPFKSLADRILKRDNYF